MGDGTMSELRDACKLRILQNWETLPGFPRTDAGLRALVDALEGGVAHAGQLGRVMDCFDDAERCPRPQAVRKAAWELFPPKRSALGCPLCVTAEYLEQPSPENPDGVLNPEYNLADPGWRYLPEAFGGLGGLTMCQCHPGRAKEQTR
jgi:hypothetical protein